MTHVMACIDSSLAAPAVCDCATWASGQLDAPLTFLHVLDDARYPVDSNLSGNIGLGSRERLLEQLAALDEQRAKLALEQGRLMLEAARERALAHGVAQPEVRQRHGNLADALQELEDETSLLVMGVHGEATGSVGQHAGSHVESVIRTVHRPILLVPASFSAPIRAMVAFDDSATARRMVEMVAGSTLLQNLSIHLVTVNSDRARAQTGLDWARAVLGRAGFDVLTAVRDGQVEAALHEYQMEFEIDLLVMGAYGKSRIREFLIGSTTTRLLRTTVSPLLLLR